MEDGGQTTEWRGSDDSRGMSVGPMLDRGMLSVAASMGTKSEGLLGIIEVGRVWQMWGTLLRLLPKHDE
jgi:hypothetical protein